jgi:MoaA/NifB/PqqE/SkfB family radical SAM enzyme
VSNLAFVWLEITGKCQLKCAHCYAESGPSGTHGMMAAADWRRVIDQAAALGVRVVQFNGGEPTLHPDLAALVKHAVGRGLRIEIFSNLVHVTPALWDLFSLTGVSLATSYYSDDPGQHAAITGRRGSHARTRANIAEAVRRGIPLRAGVIELGDPQRWEAAVAQLKALGVTDIGIDHLRQVGRGACNVQPSMNQLCGNCAAGVLAIRPDGTATPCVFARWPHMAVGNVLEASLADIMAGSAVTDVRRQLEAHFQSRRRRRQARPSIAASSRKRPARHRGTSPSPR